MRRFLLVLAAALFIAMPARAADIAVQSWNTPWDAGAENCEKRTHEPLEIRRYDETTYVLRENLCTTWEAPFMYLLIGDRKALLIDTGDVADAQKVALASIVSGLVTHGNVSSLTVAHTHRHLDHRAGDTQFAKLPNVQVVGYDIDSVKRFYGFKNWPNGVAHIDLGNRVVDVIPTPGHNETHVVFYDEKTAVLFSGDYLMPGRLLLDDPSASIVSAKRVADFLRNRPVAAVLGGHIEMNRAGEVYDWESTYHPNEHALAMTKADVLALPGILAKFNGFYTQVDHVLVIDPMRNLLAAVIGALITFAGALALVILGFKRWRRKKLHARTAS